MKELVLLLDEIVKNTTFDTGNRDMWQEVNSRVFTSNPDEIITSSMLRDAASRRWEEHSDVFEVPNMVMIVADRLVGCLEKLVRQHLGEFINEGRDLIGHAFPIESSYSVQTTTGQRNDIVCISCVTPVVEFSKALIQAAAILGSERIVNLLSGWKSGTPVTYRVCAILNVSINGTPSWFDVTCHKTSITAVSCAF